MKGKRIAKFKVGQEVWYFGGGRIRSGIIELCVKTDFGFKYSFVARYSRSRGLSVYSFREEGELFKTKQAFKNFIKNYE